jgi:hypothetical protein
MTEERKRGVQRRFEQTIAARTATTPRQWYKKIGRIFSESANIASGNRIPSRGMTGFCRPGSGPTRDGTPQFVFKFLLIHSMVIRRRDIPLKCERCCDACDPCRIRWKRAQQNLREDRLHAQISEPHPQADS